MNWTRILPQFSRISRALTFALVPFAFMGMGSALADPIAPAPDGTGTIVTPQDNQFNISGGSLSRDQANLFHSFQQFGLDSNQIANFLANPQIRNILGRVVGGDPSVIHGLIRVSGGNANLFLMNPAGFVFGADAQLDVPANFSATTANGIQLGDQWFSAVEQNNYSTLVGDPSAYAFTQSESGSIVNAGDLTLQPGKALTLVAGTVANTGKLSAPAGQVVVVSMPEPGVVRFSQPGQVLSLEFEVDPSEDLPADWSLPIAQLPQLLNLTQDYDLGFTLKPDGTVELSVSHLPVPTTSGTTIVSGQVDVSGQTGGTAAILGKTVGVLDGQINASGNQGGGTILVGGGYQGQGSVPNAEVTVVDRGSSLQADALTSGNGGQVVVWSDQTTSFSGGISARGGASGGDGGAVEVSGKQNLALNGSIDVSAPQGNSGTILLDPQDIIIEPDDGLTEDNAQVSDSQILFGDGGTTTDFQIDDTALTALTGNILLQATRDVIAQSGANLFFFNQTTGETVTFTAGRDITLNSLLSTNGGSVNLTTTTGNILTTGIDTNGGSINLNAKGNITFGSSSVSRPVLTSYSSGNVGDITLVSGGSIDASAVDSGVVKDLLEDPYGLFNFFAIDATSSNGNGGNISLTASGDITLGTIGSDALADGSGGNITITSTGGNINAIVRNIPTQVGSAAGLMNTGLINSGSAGRGNGGNITLTAFGNISVGNLISTPQNGGNAGNITIQSTNGSINAISSVTFQGTSLSQSAEAGLIVSGSADSSGGNVTITAPGSIRTGIIATGSAGSGTGGNISLTSTGGEINTTMNLGNVSSSVLQDFGLSANLANLLSQASVNLGILTTSSYRGNSGSVNLNAAGNIQTGTIVTAALRGNAGSVNLTSSGGAIDTSFDKLIGGTSAALWQALAQQYSLNTVNTPSGNTLSVTDASNLIGSAAVRPGILAFSDRGTGGNVTLTANGNITTSNIVTSSINSTGGNISLSSSNGAIDGSAGVLFENVSSGLVTNLGFDADTGRVIEFFSNPTVAFGGYITLSIQGNAGSIALNAANGITTNYLATSSFAGRGGNISLNTNSGSVRVGKIVSNIANGIQPTNLVQNRNNDTLERLVQIVSKGNLNSSGASGGNITVQASNQIVAAGVNSSGTSGNGGNVFLDPNSIELSFINAQGGVSGRGGSVTISVRDFLRITRTFVDRNNILASISTAGGLGGGAIDLTFTGFNFLPFVIGDASRNGTAGAITTGNFTIFPGSDLSNIFFTTRLGNIAIKTFDPSKPSTSNRPEPEGCENNPESCTIRPLPLFPVQTLNLPNLDEARKVLEDIEKATGIRPALIYANFRPERFFPENIDLPTLFSDLEGGFAQEFDDRLDLPQKVASNGLNYASEDSDRLEILVVTAQGDPVRVPVEEATRGRMVNVVKLFRDTLQDRRPDKQLLPGAQQLYQWLVAPIANMLQERQIQNLVFIMDQDLRLIPLAALHDGQQYIIENYSVGLMPSLSLTNTEYVPVRGLEVLAMGAQDFPDPTLNPLPAVPIELSTVTQLWSSPSPIEGADFTPERLRAERSGRRFGIVHLATHGEFKPGDLSNSYIQFSDRKLSLNELRDLRLDRPPTELMVLSACRTALGSEEAELGFAGLANQIGVKSALGSLWYVGDESTLGLMTSFYENLREAPIKAEALRQAQLAMLRGNIQFEGGQLVTNRGNYPVNSSLAKDDLTHPFAWSAFTMIGSPW